MTITPGTLVLRAGAGHGAPKPCVGEYDFAVDGGAVGMILLRGDTIPANAIVVDSLLEVITGLAGGTPTDTVSLGSEAAADVQAAAARNAAPWTPAAPYRMTRNATAAPVRVTVPRRIRMDIAGTALTAGRLRVVAWYVETAAP